MKNKYQEALEKIVKSNDNEHLLRCECCDILQELVDKATPKKPPIIWKHADPKTRCSCSAGVIPAHNYCWNCGQKLDWSDSNEE